MENIQLDDHQFIDSKDAETSNKNTAHNQPDTVFDYCAAQVS